MKLPLLTGQIFWIRDGFGTVKLVACAWLLFVFVILLHHGAVRKQHSANDWRDVQILPGISGQFCAKQGAVGPHKVVVRLMYVHCVPPCLCLSTSPLYYC